MIQLTTECKVTELADSPGRGTLEIAIRLGDTVLGTISPAVGLRLEDLQDLVDGAIDWNGLRERQGLVP